MFNIPVTLFKDGILTYAVDVSCSYYDIGKMKFLKYGDNVY